MTEEPQTTDDRFHDTAMGILFLLVGLVILFMAVVSLFIQKEHWTPIIAVGVVWLIVVLVGSGIGFIGRCRNQPWADRLGSFIAAVTVVGIAAIVVNGLLRKPTTLALGLGRVLAVWWVGFGLFLYLSARRNGEPSDEVTGSPHIIAIWPFFFAMKGLTGIILLLVPILFLSAMYFILYKLGWRYAGILLSPALMIALIVLRLRRRR
jgi:hypothetical protein